MVSVRCSVNRNRFDSHPTRQGFMHLNDATHPAIASCPLTIPRKTHHHQCTPSTPHCPHLTHAPPPHHVRTTLQITHIKHASLKPIVQICIFRTYTYIDYCAALWLPPRMNRIPRHGHTSSSSHMRWETVIPYYTQCVGRHIHGYIYSSYIHKYLQRLQCLFLCVRVCRALDEVVQHGWVSQWAHIYAGIRRRHATTKGVRVKSGRTDCDWRLLGFTPANSMVLYLNTPIHTNNMHMPFSKKKKKNHRQR